MKVPWLGMLPLLLLGAAILVDSALRRGKLDFVWALISVIWAGFVVTQFVTDEVERKNPAYAVGCCMAACLGAFVLYRIVTHRQSVKRGSECRSCGAKLGLFNRCLNEPNLCKSCARPTSVIVKCPQCGATFGRATKEMIGTTGECGKCGAEFDVDADGIKPRQREPGSEA
ncbi:MAG TPA: hypothetical protein VNE39_13355 [Planctomycetota bacterium]|nr:hypothetical protein [Planctomycetota bacterium]